MNLSKTAKRFLSSTMAIALAGGSVLAFGNSALADPPGTAGSGDATVDFETIVAEECAIETASDITAYTRANTTIAGEDRTETLTANDDIVFDCNTSTVQVEISGTGTTYTAPTGGATDLTASHTFQYGLNATPSVDVVDGVLGSTTTTDADGDLTISIKSEWDANSEELSAQTYGAETTFTVTAQ